MQRRQYMIIQFSKRMYWFPYEQYFQFSGIRKISLEMLVREQIVLFQLQVVLLQL